MQLRFGILIKSGDLSSEKGGSLPSTQASSSRTPIFNPSSSPKDIETSSESSMSIEPKASVRMSDEAGLNYNTKLNFQQFNDFNAKSTKTTKGDMLLKLKIIPPRMNLL